MFKYSGLARRFSDARKVKLADSMADLHKLSPEKLEASQANSWTYSLGLKGWNMGKDEKREYMEREFKFKDFRQAFEFMRLTSAVADQLDHHPEWFNVYNTVKVLLSTHTVNGLSCKDMLLAASMQEFASQASSQDFTGKSVPELYHLTPQQDSKHSQFFFSVKQQIKNIE